MKAQRTTEEREHLLAETWRMIEWCAGSRNQLQQVHLTPTDCAALLEERKRCGGMALSLDCIVEEVGLDPLDRHEVVLKCLSAQDRVHVIGLPEEFVKQLALRLYQGVGVEFRSV